MARWCGRACAIPVVSVGSDSRHSCVARTITTIMAEAPGPSGLSEGSSESEFNNSSASERLEASTASSSSCSELNSSSYSAMTSLLSHLRVPKSAGLAGKRIEVNPPVGKKRGKGCETNDPKSVSPSKRVKSYPSEPFKVSNKKLFCSGCR